MKMAYVLTDGCYSDYRILAVFDNRRDAEAFQKKWLGDIEEWPVNPGVEEANRGLANFYVKMARDGGVLRVGEVRPCSPCEEQNPNIPPALRGITFSVKDWKEKEWTLMQGEVWATDEAHAVKIMNEKRAFALAIDWSPFKK